MRLRASYRSGAGQPPLLVDDPVEGRHLIPNVSRKDGTHINEHGYRGHSFALEPPKGTIRFVVLGDSTTWGGAKDETTFPAFLEKNLNEKYNGNPPVEVVNAGVVGFGAVGAKKHLERRIVKIKPHYLLIYSPANDFYTIMTKKGQTTEDNTGNVAESFLGRWSPTQWRQRHSIMFNAFLDKVKNLNISPQAVAVQFLHFPDYGKPCLQKWYADLVNTSKQLGIKPVMLTHCYPIRSNYTVEEANRFMKGHFFGLGAMGAIEAVKTQNEVAREVAEQAGTLFIDVENAVPSDDEYFQQDGLHFNDKGNAVFAKVLADKLDKLGIINAN